MRVVMWGTYDTGKPRNRILLRGLRENGVEVIECHRDIWGSVEDKSQVSGLGARIRFLLRWLFSYPALIARYLRLPSHDLVLVGYLGQLDVLVLWPFAKLRGTPVVWDVFISLYNTVVEDRRLVGSGHVLARLLLAWEWLASRAADLLVMDTRAHADYFARQCVLGPERVATVWVGTEEERFAPAPDGRPSPSASAPLTVFFYGQFTPLHGIETIVAAARMGTPGEIRWILAGRGQEEERIRALLDAEPVPDLEWIPWIPYEALVESIRSADVCLGVFGDTDKAARVIPNKVFQILSAGAPLVTRDGPAIRELLSPDSPGVALIPAADAGSLLDAVRRLGARHRTMHEPEHRDLAQRIDTRSIGGQLRGVLERVTREIDTFR
jgi:glycosyltransferase involved in cell wall biosynthesis